MDPAQSPENVEMLSGAWTRKSICWPDGREDTSTRVWWLQGLPWFADMRLPAKRPSFAGVSTLADCDADQRLWISSVHGFAGRLTRHDHSWLWQRDIDFQPPSEKRDIGTLEFLDAERRRMKEKGVDEPYEENWERIDAASSPGNENMVACLSDVGLGIKGVLIASAIYFLMAVDRRCDRSSDPLDMELSHGIRKGGWDIQDWTVSDSSHPWREGEKLFPTGVLIDWVTWNLWEFREEIKTVEWKIMQPSQPGGDEP